MKRIFYACVAAMLALPGPAQAQGFQTTDNCLETVKTLNAADKALLGAWVIGFLDSSNASDGTLVRSDNAEVVVRNVTAFCEANPELSLLEVVRRSTKNVPQEAGTKANAEAFLSQFLDPGADRVTLTAAIFPTEADIRAVYAPALADLLVPAYAGMFQPGIQIGPKEGQTQVIVWRGTTASLKRGDPVLGDFPGGYEDVRQYMQGNFPIVRFKFVRPGETLGMAFDGLVYVNDRWVLMPKPWNVLR